VARLSFLYHFGTVDRGRGLLIGADTSRSDPNIPGSPGCLPGLPLKNPHELGTPWGFGAVVIDLTDLKATDPSNHAKFAQLAEIAPEMRRSWKGALRRNPKRKKGK
jgi:hypothetical protein